VARSRTFDTKRNRIQDFFDAVFSDLLERIEALEQPEPAFNDALLNDLARDRTGEMRDIVKTIQSAQYELLQVPLDRLLVIQGGPGTGKTAIALHRVSYLLFNNPELRDQDVLVVGPNPTFSRYIKDLLPDLGDVDVVQSNLTSLGPLASDRRMESEEVAALKGSARMVDFLARALAARIRVPESADDDLLVNTRAGTVRIPIEEIRAAVSAARSQRTYMSGRARLREEISDLLSRRSSGSLGASPQQIDSALDRIWPSLTAASFLRELFGSKDRLIEAAGADFTAQEVGLLYRQAAERIGDETWADADVALLDEADFLIRGTPEKFQHVVVDEAQDLSPMQMRSLRRRSTGSMTIVGDLAQSTGAFARDGWDELVQSLRQEATPQIEELQYGYRVPRQVMDLAAQLLAVAAPSITAPRVIRDAPAEPEFLQDDPLFHAGHAVEAARDYAGRGLSVGVIAPEAVREGVIEEFNRNGVKWRDADSGVLGSGINLISPSESKGLEFDAVVVVSPEEIAKGRNGYRHLYIALTRTTRFLSVVYFQDPLAFNVVSTDSSNPDQVTEDRRPPNSGSTDQRDVAHHKEGRRFRPQRRLNEAMATAVATEVAQEIRATIPSHLWSEVWESIGHQLDVWRDQGNKRDQ
jgi:DNA helicase IV